MTTTAELIRAEYEARECRIRAIVLVEQLTLKFGPLTSATIRDLIDLASMKELKAWSASILTATTLDEVLGSAPSELAARRNRLAARLQPGSSYSEGFKNLAKRSAKGLPEAEARAIGRAAVLAHEIMLKFGSLPPGIHEAIDAASLDQLEAWTAPIATATKLDEIRALVGC